ncbi:MAG TPA: NAD(P)H-hydrate dehydratase [Nocardioidaceae bacterium]|nr:NAD(P)H-hydrate dehydratase [Nocardioidaceae bacterium]
MRSAHTVEQVRAGEAALMASLPEGTLMARAASGLAHAVLELLGGGYGRRVLLLVGSGDNGGDALYAGALLSRRGAAVQALLLRPDKAHPAGLKALRGAGGRVVTDLSAARTPDVVVDGIVGIGASGGLRAEAASVVERLPTVPVVAVDVPSGVDVDTGRVDGPHVQATVTVTFGTHKIAHLVDPAAPACGAVHLVDIGLDLPPAQVTSLQADDVAALLPVPEPDAHKYTRGVVGVRAGSRDYPGAAVLCVAGAAAGLAGMVRYDGEAADLVREAHPEVVVNDGRVQAWVVGSGGGADADKALQASLADRVPIVVDADGLTHVTGPLGVPALLTPHAGELARMLDVGRAEVEAEQLRCAREAARRFGCVVLLKGRHTLVAAPDGDVRVSTVGVPWLATAGSGDVLAGLCGALLAAGLTPLDAGSVGAWVHGAAAATTGRGGPVTAGDVARAIPDVCRTLLAPSRV